MEQNTIAVIWDFDKTLVNGYMQKPIFDEYNVDERKFWEEVNSLEKRYADRGIKVNRDTIYLNHMLTCVQQGIFGQLTNAKLEELGRKIEFYKGVPDIFTKLKGIVESEEKYKSFGIHVEHYIVSTGLTAMIKGSIIAEHVSGIWGCEFIDEPIRSSLDTKVDEEYIPGEIKQVGYIIDNTSKTRAVFEINKGVNMYEYIDVNSKIETKDRRVPFENMVYIADGPSDVPVFSVLKQNGGNTFAIYPQGDANAFKQVDALRQTGRVDMYAEADYSEGTTAFMWLKEKVSKIAENIWQRNDEQIRKSVKEPPRHLV